VSAAPLSFPRKLGYAAILTAVTLALLLGGTEIILRLAGFGYSPHFFRSVTLPGGERIWRENRWCTAPYFSTELVRRPQPVRLPAKKAAGTYRIFVLGSSAAMGDPEPAFSLSRMLEAMLRAAYPDRHFEVVNAGITAINSHLVREFAADCAALEPDLFIVYEGNNEVIGPFGPAGVFSPFLRTETGIRAAVWLKGTRTGQLFGRLGHGKTAGEWGGMEMFLRQQIAADDPRLESVRANFRANLRAIAASAKGAGASTLVCTVPVNQRDFAPFLSVHRIGLTAAELNRWQESFAAGEKAEAADDPATAEQNYRQALAIDDRFAELPFRLGRLALRGGNDAEARNFFQRAVDLDALRFRTDSALNQIVRELPASGAAQLEVVDLAADLAEASPHGIIGNEMLYEHVHLDLRGTYESACRIFPHIVADLMRRQLVTRPQAVPFDYADAHLRLGYNTYEQTMIGIELMNRFQRPPFSGQLDNAARVQTWQRRLDTAKVLLARPDALPALQELAHRALALAPNDWMLQRNTGAMLVSCQAPAEALPLLEQARRWIDDDVDTLVALGWAQRALGHAAEAEEAFARARSLEPRYPGLPKADGAPR
jgi:tetratricopeptide (TPR) repeat protein